MYDKYQAACHAMRCLIVCLTAFLAGCALTEPKIRGLGDPLAWTEIHGWHESDHRGIWPAFMHTCSALGGAAPWHDICRSAGSVSDDDNRQIRTFFETWFTPRRIYGIDGGINGKITGYYEPLLHGSFEQSERYRFPIYRVPEELLVVELGDLYPQFKGRHIRGRLQGNRVVPFYSRGEIDSNRKILRGDELLWVDNRDDVFFLHIQGSGRVQLEDGKTVGVGYANQNGHPYVAIGRVLLQRGEMPLEDISLFSIRKWLDDHPQQAEELLFANPSYVFFTLREGIANTAVGSLNVPLTAERSIAIDPEIIPLGTPVWLDTTLPDQSKTRFRQLVMAQDTGGAIRGPIRGDLFWGHGEYAERMAGLMNQQGTMIALVPQPQSADE